MRGDIKFGEHGAYPSNYWGLPIKDHLPSYLPRKDSKDVFEELNEASKQRPYFEFEFDTRYIRVDPIEEDSRAVIVKRFCNTLRQMEEKDNIVRMFSKVGQDMRFVPNIKIT